MTASGQQVTVAPRVLDGDAPGITINGVPPDSRVVVHLIRQLEKYETDPGGNWQLVKKRLHAWAEFQANESGEVLVDTAQPLNGTYSRPDPLALLRTGYLTGDARLSNVHPFEASDLDDATANDVFIRVEQDDMLIAENRFQLMAEKEGLVFETVAKQDLNGIFARPGNDRKLPVVITLHGSEGGSTAKARNRAAQFASRGYATLAINYFAYPHEGIEGVSSVHLETPVEMIESARNWLANRDDIDTQHISLYGVSKGAEFALVAASKYDWIDSAIAVVPSDVVWAGYGDDNPNVEQRSSWSFAGKPEPFIPLFPFDPEKAGLYRTNTERYSRSRAFYDDLVPAAHIPIEKATAQLLLLASDRDEVWASGEMARNLVERMVDAGKQDQVAVHIFPRAGHQIAGTGTFPVRLYGVQSDDPNAKDIMAEGEAAAEAWRLTIEFLERRHSK